MVNFTAADRVGAIGGYIGGISALLGGLGSWNGGCQNGNYVSKETFEMQTKLTEAEKNNAILSADLASEKKMVEVYNASIARTNSVREELSGRILDLERIDGELEDAKHYAEKYIECKARGSGDRASKYHAMAEDELKHAAWLHEMAAGEITELDKVFRPTEEMHRSWDDSHARYVERAAWVRRMLEM